MSEDTLTCLACGFEGRRGRDVYLRLVEVPISERRKISVLMRGTKRDESDSTSAEVIERYATEPRCKDVGACAERVAANELVELERATAIVVAPPEPSVEEDPLAWL